jgi:hypothetical protein
MALTFISCALLGLPPPTGAQTVPTAIDRYLTCAEPFLADWSRSMDALAARYRHFRPAWDALKTDEAKLTSKLQDPVQGASINSLDASNDIWRRFIDLICQVAEAEAVESFLRSRLKLKQDVEAHCGPVPRDSPPG